MTDFLRDAEYRTESWQRRHSPEVITQLGVWRWKGIQKYAGRILDLICGKRVIDFGGFDGPLGFGSIVVDQKAEYKTLDDVLGQVGVIFTSHTLEHLDDPATWLHKALARLANGGYLIVHVPAWTCERWRADQYTNERQPTGHRHTFCLWPEVPCVVRTPEEWITITESIAFKWIDRLVPGNIELAEYVGDDSILVIARKP